MPGRWLDASRDAESWDDEQPQAGCLREVVVYDLMGGERGAAFVRITRKGRTDHHGALCWVEFLGATAEDYYWFCNPAAAGSPGAITKKELIHFCRCCARECQQSGMVQAPSGYGLQHASVHHEVFVEELVSLRRGILFPDVVDKIRSRGFSGA